MNYERPEHGRAQSTEELSGWPETYLDSSIASAMNPPRNVYGQAALGLWSTHTHWFIRQTKTEVVRYLGRYVSVISLYRLNQVYILNIFGTILASKFRLVTVRAGIG